MYYKTASHLLTTPSPKRRGRGHYRPAKINMNSCNTARTKSQTKTCFRHIFQVSTWNIAKRLIGSYVPQSMLYDIYKYANPSQLLSVTGQQPLWIGKRLLFSYILILVRVFNTAPVIFS